MKILALNWRDPRNPEAGGAEVHLHHILKRAVTAGHRVVQVSHRVKGLPDRETIDGVEIHRDGSWYSYNLSARKFCEALGLSSFDLILEDICKVPLFSPGWSDTPVLAVVPHLFGTTAYREVGCLKALYVNALESMIPRVYQNCTFVAISDSTKHDLVRRGIPGESIQVVPCGMDTGIYNPDPRVPVEHGMFLYVGRLRKYKGVQFALRAVSMLRNRGISASLTVLGEGDYARKLHRLANRLDLVDHVCFEGFVPLERKLDRLRTCYAAVFPSEKEGWGLTVIEANCCGAPVIASRSDGLTDSVRDGETGILTPHGDVSALADAMQKLMENPGERERLSALGVKWGGSFDWDQTGARMLSIMEKAVNGRSKASPQEMQATRPF
jgi:glycosyltransferase involved in cell wall biosynthesis